MGGLSRPVRDDVRDDIREDLARMMARAQADGRLALDSASSEANDGNAAARLREYPMLYSPKHLPNVANLNDWNIRVAFVLVQASGYGGQKEVQWFQECKDASRSLESFENSGGRRFAALDDKLAHATQSVADTNSAFRRELERLARREFIHGRLLTGRQM